VLDKIIGRGQNDPVGRAKVGSAASGGGHRPPLGGGAARGFAHIGIIRTLIAHGIVPDVVVGTSIGAVVGGAYAAGPSRSSRAWARSLQRETFSLSRYPPQRLRTDRRRQACSTARSGDGPDHDRGSAAEICDRRHRSPHRPRNLAHARAHGRKRCAPPMRYPEYFRRCWWEIAGWWTAPWSICAGIGGAARWRRDRHRRQSLQRRVAHSTTIYSHGASAEVTVAAGRRRNRTCAAETRLWQILFSRTHHEARIFR